MGTRARIMVPAATADRLDDAVARVEDYEARWSRFVPGAMVGLVAGTAVVALGGLEARWHLATIGSEFGTFSHHFPALQLPGAGAATIRELIQPAFTIALLVAMQALLCAVVTDTPRFLAGRVTRVQLAAACRACGAGILRRHGSLRSLCDRSTSSL